jgi:transcriptional regulator with XRE-family HTH domain
MLRQNSWRVTLALVIHAAWRCRDRSRFRYQADQSEAPGWELGGQSQVASVLRVNRAQVTRWLRGARPDPPNEARIDALEFVLARLRQTLASGTAIKWLTGVNAHLGNRRPIDLLADHRVAEVVAAIEQEQNDSYA